ncbi:MAG: undecaprenyl-diphosphate phosphatase [Aerococcus sp.]|nr:undecaprenyl-diphosphate phosphatase [Aerococcus sp.]
MLEIIKIIIYGIIEGITEWLPISSTGHLILIEEFMNLSVRAEFLEIFRVVIQLGAILAVVLIYFERLNPFSSHKSADQKQQTWSTWVKVIIGCIPAGLLGVLLDDWMDAHLMNWFVVSLALIVYGIAFIWIENRNAHHAPVVSEMSQLSLKKAIQIGLFQALSLVPGTSRSGSSILGGILMGASRPVATDFSFFMSIPIMFGASGYKLLKGLKNGFRFTGHETFLLILGMLVAFLVSLVVIKFLLRYVETNDFKPFGWYRIILGVLVILWFTRAWLWKVILTLIVVAAIAFGGFYLYARNQKTKHE